MQQKIYYEKNRDKLLQKQNDYSKKEAQIIKNYKDPMLNYKKKLKALEEKFKINESEKH